MQIVTSRTPSGVLTRSVDMPGRVYGSLVFGVARRDEPLALRGITAMTRDLIVDGLYPQMFEVEARLMSEELAFQVSGSSGEVQSRLQAIADVVHELVKTTEADFARIRRRAERLGRGGPAIESTVLSARFGLGEIGLEGLESQDLPAITLSAVVQWVAEWFVAENAAVTMTNSPPAMFDIVLPRLGRVPARRPFAPSLIDQPTLAAIGTDGLVLSLVMPSAVADVVYLPLLGQLYDDSVISRDLALDVSTLRPPRVDASLSHITIRFLGVQRAKDVARIVAALRKVSFTGVTVEALGLALEKLRRRYSEANSLDVRLGRICGVELRGILDVGPQAELDHAAHLTAEDVARAVADALPTLLVAVNSQRLDIVDTLERKGRLGMAFDRRGFGRSVDEAAWLKASGEGSVFTTSGSARKSESVALTTRRLLVRSGARTSAVEFDDVLVVGDHRPWSITLLDRQGRREVYDDWTWDHAFFDALMEAVPQELVEKW